VDKEVNNIVDTAWVEEEEEEDCLGKWEGDVTWKATIRSAVQAKDESK
jgi:hypothetical protein